VKTYTGEVQSTHSTIRDQSSVGMHYCELEFNFKESSGGTMCAGSREEKRA
jgi:hypothetical protein